MSDATDRDVDAGFFEDWSEWKVLDPRAPSYYVSPVPARLEYAISTPVDGEISRILRYKLDAWFNPWCKYKPFYLCRVPGKHWRLFRRYLPIIRERTKIKIDKHEAHRAKEEAFLAARRDEDREAAKRLITNAINPGQRTPLEQLDVLGNALMMGGLRLSHWERKFLESILARRMKYEDKTMISDKQATVIKRLHKQVKYNIM